LLGGRDLPLAAASGFEQGLNQVQYPSVSYSLSYQREQLFVIHRSKEIFQIRIHDPYSIAVNLTPNLTQGILGGAPSPIAEVGFFKYRLKDRL
jgi:hypothetical protein